MYFSCIHRDTQWNWETLKVFFHMLISYLKKKQKQEKTYEEVDLCSFGVNFSGVLIYMKSFTTEEACVSFPSLPAGQDAHVLENTQGKHHGWAHRMRTRLTALYLLESFSIGEKFLDFWIMICLIHLNLQGSATDVLSEGWMMIHTPFPAIFRSPPLAYSQSLNGPYYRSGELTGLVNPLKNWVLQPADSHFFLSKGITVFNMECGVVFFPQFLMSFNQPRSFVHHTSKYLNKRRNECPKRISIWFFPF